MRNSSSMPGWRALASRYCCIIGVVMGSRSVEWSMGVQTESIGSVRRKPDCRRD